MQSLKAGDDGAIDTIIEQTAFDAAWKFVEADYELLEQLGQGSYGRVVKARHRRTGTICAIKHIKDVFFNIYEAKKILREIHILRKLSAEQSNLFMVKLLDVIVPPLDDSVSMSKEPELIFNEVFLVQECFGMDICQFIKQRNQYSLKEDHIAIIIYNILCGVQLMHSAHVIHRDLKPANILINEECNVKLCDYGLARTLQQPPTKSCKKEDGQEVLGHRKSSENQSKNNQDQQIEMTARIGSRFYRAPEVIVCSPNYEYSVDIWSVGCILGELLLNFVERKEINQESANDGDSCYPLSPCAEEMGQGRKDGSKQTISVSQSDQLIKIIELLGKPSEKDFSYLDMQTKVNYIQSICQSFSFENKIDQKFQKSSPDIKNLLMELLTLNPQKRKTAKELLKLKIFEGIGEDELIVQASKKIQLAIDEQDSNIKSNTSNNLLTIQNMILKEAKKVRKSNYFDN